MRRTVDAPALATQAAIEDRLLRAAVLGHRVDGKGNQGTLQRSPTAPSKIAGPTLETSPSIVRRAGHAEDLCFLSGAEWMVKRMDVTETNQYVGFRNGVNAPPTAPDFLGPFYDVDDVLGELMQLGHLTSVNEVEKLEEMATTIQEGGPSFMILSSAKRGNADSELRDLKLGQHSASGTDQARRGKSKAGSLLKTGQHDWMDEVSGSRERGFRDEDAWKSASKWDKVTNKNRVKRANLNPLTTMLNGASRQALQAIEGDLESIRAWLETANPIFVGMSVLVVVHPNVGALSNATTIDFEHPIYTGDDSYGTHQAGLLLGVDNMLAMVRNATNYQAVFVMPPPSDPIPIPARNRDYEEVFSF